jgi:hypothetical protein
LALEQIRQQNDLAIRKFEGVVIGPPTAAAPTAQRKWRVGRARKSSPSAGVMAALARQAHKRLRTPTSSFSWTATVRTIDWPSPDGRRDRLRPLRLCHRVSRARQAGHPLAAGLVAGALIWLLYGMRYTDMCAYRAIRRNALLALGMRELTYGWNLEMQMRVARAGLRVLELPVAYRRRAGGRSKVAGSLRGTLRSGLHIITAFARVAMEPLLERARRSRQCRASVHPVTVCTHAAPATRGAPGIRE